MVKQESLDNAKIVGSPIVHKVCLFLLLFAFWMALAGSLKTKFVIYGIITAATTVWMCYPLLLVPNKDGSRKYFVFGISIFKFISYSIWLMWQLVLANIDVLKATTSQNLDIDPKVVRFYFKVDKMSGVLSMICLRTYSSSGLYAVKEYVPGKSIMLKL